MLPRIRYPLPSLVLLILLVILFRHGERITRPVRSSLSSLVKRAVEGPEYPASDHPMVVAGPIVRRALLLREDVPATTRPGGTTAETLKFRMFVDVYDVWPLEGTPTSYRVGTRRPIGWVASADLMPWDTRLVARLPAQGKDGSRTVTADERFKGDTLESSPMLRWDAESVELAVWDQGGPWREVSGWKKVRISDLSAESWGVWLSREELLVLLRKSIESSSPEHRQALRLRAILGRLSDETPLTEDDLRTARKALPAAVFAESPGESGLSSQRLGEVNQDWRTESSWSGVAFAAIPLSTLP